MDLYPHNQTIFNSTIENLKSNSRVCIVQATGTGKSAVGSELANYYLNSGKVLIIAPTNAILEHYKLNLGLSDRVKCYTYSMISGMFDNQLRGLSEDCSLVIFDEFHRLGARTWGPRCEVLSEYIERNNGKIVGLSATPVRFLDYERDMSLEFFNDNVIYGADIVNAMLKGILPLIKKYIACYYGYEEDIKKLLNDIDEKKIRVSKHIKEIISNKSNKYSIEQIIKKETFEMSENQKWVVFFRSKDELERFVDVIGNWFNYPATVYTLHSYQSTKENIGIIEEFNNKETGVNVLLTIDMLNEGIHVKNVNGVILLRKTISPIIFMQQIGRCLSFKGKEPYIFDFIGNYRNLTAYKYGMNIYKLIDEVNNSLTDIETVDKSIMVRGSERKIIVKNYCEELEKIFEELKKLLNASQGKSYLFSNEEIDIIKKYYKTLGLKQVHHTYLPHIPDYTIQREAVRLGLVEKRNVHIFTNDEIEIIKKYYETEGAKGIQEKYLPDLSLSVLRGKAKSLKLSYLTTPHKKPYKWTDEELEIVKKYYSAGGVKEVHKYLPHIENRVIQSCAEKMGIAYQIWTDEEIRILKEYYISEGANISKRLQRHTIHSIRQKAKKLGIKQPYIWTDEKLAILKEYYPIEGMQVLKRLEGITKRQVQSVVYRYGLTVNNRKYTKSEPWTEEEIELLKKHYPIIGSKVIKYLTNRTKDMIRFKANDLGIKFFKSTNNQNFTLEEDELIKKYYPTEGTKVAERLNNRTRDSVRARARRLNVYATDLVFPDFTNVVREKWTPEEDEIIRKYYPTEGHKVYLRLPNRTVSAVSKHAVQLKVFKDKTLE